MLKIRYSNNKFECGIDEAGRGCLAGPVTAAAVILKPNFKDNMIIDSKKLTANKRKEIGEIIKKNSISYSIQNVFPKKIDEINILNSSILAMHKCIDDLIFKPDFIIVDGNIFYKYGDIPHKTIIKGDEKYLSIAAASILAKNFRDEYMIEIDKKFPKYNWIKNKGYPTKQHKAAIMSNGATKHHRKSFRLFDEQLIIDF